MLDKCEAADVEGPDVVDMAMNLVSIVQTEFEPTEFESEFDLLAQTCQHQLAQTCHHQLAQTRMAHHPKMPAFSLTKDWRQ